MQFRFLTLAFLFILASCGSSTSLSTKTDVAKLSKSKLIKLNKSKSFANAVFNTVKIKSKMSYKIGDASHKLGMSLRIAKGEKIWMSADFLGIPVAKMVIKKDSIHYYNKIDKTYFNGSFEFVKELVGVNVTYSVLESLFTGDLAINLENGKYRMFRSDVDYYLRNSDFNDYRTYVEIYPLTYKTKSQSISHHSGKNLFAAFYKNHQEVDEFLFPKDFEIHGKNKDKETILSISYSSVKFNEDLNFPYKVPKDCDKEIILNAKKVKK